MNSMWPANLPFVAGGPAFRLESRNVLLEFNGPTVGIFTDEDTHTYLGIWCDEDRIRQIKRWVLVHARMARLSDIINRRIPLRTAFDHQTVAVVDFDDDFQQIERWSIPFDDLPEGLKPLPQALLPQVDHGNLYLHNSIRLAGRYDNWRVVSARPNANFARLQHQGS